MELQIHENFFIIIPGVTSTPSTKDVKTVDKYYDEISINELEPPAPQLVQGQVFLMLMDSPDVI